ncbi:hypothetical protein AAVH_16807 [Aphelenchoides avenae]|nr:hypothetical protein AAVH_16807 [Aphelenchus avenae]
MAVNELYICGVVPVDSCSIGYRRRESAVRSIVRSFEKFRVPECFEFAMSELTFSHVDYMVIDNYYMVRELTRLIAQNASHIRVKDFYCSNLSVLP